MTHTAAPKSNSAAPLAAVAALAAVTLFMIASLLGVGQSMDADPHAGIAVASTVQANG